MNHNNVYWKIGVVFSVEKNKVSEYNCTLLKKVYVKCWFPLRQTRFAGTASVSSSLENPLLLHRFASFVANELCKLYLHNSLTAGPSAHAVPAEVAASTPINWNRFFQCFTLKFLSRSSKVVVYFWRLLRKKRNKLDPAGNELWTIRLRRVIAGA